MGFLKQIEPKIVLDLVVTKLDTYVINYNGISCQMYWALLTDDNETVYNGNWTVPQDVLNNWGADDNIIITALAEAKGLKIIE